VLEVEWRSNGPEPGILMIHPRIKSEAKDGITLNTYYYTGNGGKYQWVTRASRLMPDTGFAAKQSATRLKSVVIRGYHCGKDHGAYTFEINCMIIRASNEEEKAYLEKWVALLRAEIRNCSLDIPGRRSYGKCGLML